MKRYFTINKPRTRTEIIGLALILLGICFLFIPSNLNIKLSFTSILIGVFWIFLVNEKSIPKNISDTQNQGAFDAIEILLRGVSGNAIFLPKSKILSEERIYIPQKNSEDELPYIDRSSALIEKSKMEILGLSLPPSGLKLLKEIEKEVNFKDIGIEKVEENLKKFIGLNLVSSIILKKHKGAWQLIITKPLSCTSNQNFCRRYPCPTCSAAITAIVHATNKTIKITDAAIDGKKITFDLIIEE